VYQSENIHTDAISGRKDGEGRRKCDDLISQNKRLYMKLIILEPTSFVLMNSSTLVQKFEIFLFICRMVRKGAEMIIKFN
jgi:hypothetical protein